MSLIILAASTATTKVANTIPPIQSTIETFTYISIGLGGLGVAIGFLIWFLQRRSK
ncbi:MULTISPECIES: hypothetical protein [Sulfolobaceae]|uniref:hypothetical protein n=1 Tax=Sulfolobaceae TaxID=118883 RepID=UPI00163DC324|nr:MULTISPECIES: hypothetical protein [unclassified Sulfolobus]